MSDPRLAAVTGTSSGIGRALARRLVDLGWTVVGLARRPAPFADSRYRHLEIDLADGGALETAIARELGPILDRGSWSRVALVNNAALAGALGPLAALDSEALARQYRVNVVAPVRLMGWITERTPPNVALRIVNLSSGAGVHPFPGLGGYAGTKAALRMSGMVLAEELKSPLRPGGVRQDVGIMSYEPGVVDTEMQTGARNTDFPWVGVFRSFLEQGLIVTPEATIVPIVEYLKTNNVDYFVERRYGS